MAQPVGRFDQKSPLANGRVADADIVGGGTEANLLIHRMNTLRFGTDLTTIVDPDHI